MENSKLGVHSLVFTDDWTEVNARVASETAARIGFDVIEALIFDPATLDVPMTGKVVRDAGLELRLGMALTPENDISSTDSVVAAKGETTVARCLEIASELGVSAVSGITYAAFNSYSTTYTQLQKEQVIGALRRLDQRAGELGVRLGLEPVNRYESYMVNTIDQAGDIIRASESKNLFIHLDTFHMNIEEADVAGAVTRNGDLIGYVHLADNHRGRIGAGTYDFTTLLRALAQVNYEGDFTVESFSQSTLSADMAGGLSLWRNAWSDVEEAATEALDFMRTNITAARRANAAR
ncbi:sugar phosphate isomerase/epimerase family protein [Thalassospira tepidiphila]|uniref:sugar phosphate isomerase/epimerase family protein n=1 Tax=Thalassospira tepidiphila TaxID=393657 RepID=UPI003AA7E4D6